MALPNDPGAAEISQGPEVFDLSPDPRILQMLGEINLPQWRCVAELVDNSIDGFLNAARRGTLKGRPWVKVLLPTSVAENARLTVRDNGPGMSPETLEQAVRAGWTGNDPINNLGMFGMGFNIATARLGTVTEVWTARREDSGWTGVQIDFGRLRQQRHFRTPRLTRPKIDPAEGGTEISITRLKGEQIQWFARTANRTKVDKELGRVYSTMLRPNGVPISFELQLNTSNVPGRQHCVWGSEGSSERIIPSTRWGPVNALQPIDRDLGERQFCTQCWQWVPQGEILCPSCQSSQAVVTRNRRVYGWIGIQRYLKAQCYGTCPGAQSKPSLTPWISTGPPGEATMSRCAAIGSRMS